MNKHLFFLLFIMATFVFYSCEKKSTVEFGGGHNNECIHCHGSGTCSSCNGTGKGSYSSCTKCNGTGIISCIVCGGKGKVYDGVNYDYSIRYKTCTSCNGTGRGSCYLCHGEGSSQSKCSSCNGTGLCSYCSGSGGSSSGGGSGSGSGSGSDSGGSSSNSHEKDERYCKYLGKTTGYWELGKDIERETVYVYQTYPGKSLRASYASPGSDGYIIKSATQEVYYGSDPWGLSCNRYMLPAGIKVYFKW